MPCMHIKNASINERHYQWKSYKVYAAHTRDVQLASMLIVLNRMMLHANNKLCVRIAVFYIPA